MACDRVHLVVEAFHSDSLPDFHEVVSNCLDLLEVSTHLIIQRSMPVSYPACIEIAFLHSHPKSADTFQRNGV